MQLDLERMKLYLPYNGDERFYNAVLAEAMQVSRRNVTECDVFQLADVIVKDALEKAEIAKEMESLINFNDEVVSVEDAGDIELMDITVTRDNLFYANGILTKNSMGIPNTADLMLSISRTEELDGLGQILWKQLKNRYGNKVDNLRFVTGIDLEKQTIYDVNQSEQNDLVSVPPPTGANGTSDTSKFRNKFSGFKFES